MGKSLRPILDVGFETFSLKENRDISSQQNPALQRFIIQTLRAQDNNLTPINISIFAPLFVPYAAIPIAILWQMHLWMMVVLSRWRGFRAIQTSFTNMACTQLSWQRDIALWAVTIYWCAYRWWSTKTNCNASTEYNWNYHYMHT